jgi:phosphate transport system substrate-binding protein
MGLPAVEGVASMIRVLFAALLALGFCGCSRSAAPLTYEGSSTIGENFIAPAAQAFTAKTGLPFGAIGLKGSGEGLKAVQEGRVDFGGMSRELRAPEKSASLYYSVIGYDAIAVFVHDQNPIHRLSREQLRQVFAGQIKNWREVGGKDEPIEVVTEVKSGSRATLQEFKHAVMEKLDFGPTKEIDKPHDCVLYVAAHPGAITHAAMAFAAPGARALAVEDTEANAGTIRSGEYLLSRPLLLISRGAPQGNVKAFFDFALSPEGQALLGKKFVPLR